MNIFKLVRSSPESAAVLCRYVDTRNVTCHVLTFSPPLHCGNSSRFAVAQPWVIFTNMSDYVMTIDSDTEDARPTSNKQDLGEGLLDPDFVFDLAGDPYSDLAETYNGLQDFVKRGSKPVSRVEILLSHLLHCITLATDFGRRNNHST